jgi:putative transposase
LLKSQFNKVILANALGQLTALIEQKAEVNGREYIEIAPKSIPDELRQLTKHYPKQLRLPRSVHLSAFQTGRYRAWPWKLTLGESYRTLNQEAAQVATLCDAKTTSKSSLENTSPILNQQSTESSTFDEDIASRTISQSFSETESALATACEPESFKQRQKVNKYKSASPTSEKQLGKKRRRSRGESDSG